MVLPLTRLVLVPAARPIAQIIPRVGRQLQRFLVPTARVGSKVVLPVGFGAVGVGLGLEAGATGVRRAGQALGLVEKTGLELAIEQQRAVEVGIETAKIEEAARKDVPFSPTIITLPQPNTADRGKPAGIDTTTLILIGAIAVGIFLISKKK